MDRAQLQQRIVGAIVLVALGVIFIPMILNREDAGSGITGSNIPPKPGELRQLANETVPAQPPVPPQPAETPQLVDKDTPSLPPAITPEVQTPPSPPNVTPPTTTPTTQSPIEPGKGHGWVVQIGSFSDRNKALQLRDRLRKAQYTAFVESTTGKHGTLYRVRVGPVIKREEADKLQSRIIKQQKLKGAIVMAYP